MTTLNSGVTVVLLGSGGGPIPMPGRRPPAQAVLVGDRAYLVDCGDGTIHQLAATGFDISDLAGVFITHAHSDHIAGLFNLAAARYHQSALRQPSPPQPLPIWGPEPPNEPPAGGWVNPTCPYPSLSKICACLLDANANELNERPGWGLPIDPRDIAAPADGQITSVAEDDRVRVTATAVVHPPTRVALAYRLDTDLGSVVFSGDTAPTPHLPSLAEGAQIIVHEAYHPGWLAETHPRVLPIFGSTHSTPHQAACAADQAGVPRLVLSHLIPGDPRLIADQQWTQAATRPRPGQVTVGHDLTCIALR